MLDTTVQADPVLDRVAQGRNELVIDAPAATIFDVLADSNRAPEYMRAVTGVHDFVEGGREEVGATRRCTLDMEGRQGEVVERCVELDEGRRISFVIERDTLGFSRFFRDFGFSFGLEPLTETRTLVALEGFYRPRNATARAMNALVMKRKLHRLRAGILTALKEVVE